MGKAKKSNKRSAGGLLGANSAFALPEQSSLRSGVSASNARDRFALSELENNLGSLEENKRANACALLSDLYQFNAHNTQSMEALAAKKLLSKLAMRLADHSTLVRVAATRALKALTEGKDLPAIQRVVAVGMFRTALSLAMENASSVALPGVSPFVPSSAPSAPSTTPVRNVALGSTEWLHWKELQQNLLYSVVNVVVASRETLDELVAHHPDFVRFLVVSFGEFSKALHAMESQLTADKSENASYLPMLNTIANALIVFCESKHNVVINELIGVEGCTTINGVLQMFYQLANATTGGTVAVSAANQDYWVIVLQCLEMLLKLFVDPELSASMQAQINTRSIITGLFQLLSACKVQGIAGPAPITSSPAQDATDVMDDDLAEGEEREIVIPHGRSTLPSAPLFDVEITEIITDFVSSLAGNITTHFSDDDALLLTSTGKGKKKKAKGMTAGQQRGLELITVLEETKAVNVAMELFSHLRTRFQLFFTPSPDYAGLQLVLHDGVKVIMTLEKVTSVVNDLYALKSVLLEHTQSSIDWTLPVPVLFEHLQFMQECVSNTTASLDTAAKAAIENWRAKEEEDLLPLKSSIITMSSSALDILAQFCSHGVLGTAVTAPNRNFIPFTEDDMKTIAVHLLRWMQFPQLEIVFSTVNVMTLLISEEKTAIAPAPLNVLMLFTNALFNRLAEPAAYAMESEKTNNKAINVKKSSLLLMDTCINAVIDLHCGDDRSYHDLFLKLQGINKLKAAVEQLHSRYQQAMVHLDGDDRDKLEETAMNLSEFINYKETLKF